MFTDSDITHLSQSYYVIIQVNHHDVTLHSDLTGHDWIIISNYDSQGCYILHRHSRKESFHSQKGNYGSLESALAYIAEHGTWF